MVTVSVCDRRVSGLITNQGHLPHLQFQSPAPDRAHAGGNPVNVSLSHRCLSFSFSLSSLPFFPFSPLLPSYSFSKKDQWEKISFILFNKIKNSFYYYVIQHYYGVPNQCNKTRKQNDIRIENNKLFDDIVIYTESPTEYTELLGEFCKVSGLKKSTPPLQKKVIKKIKSNRRYHLQQQQQIYGNQEQI